MRELKRTNVVFLVQVHAHHILLGWILDLFDNAHSFFNGVSQQVIGHVLEIKILRRVDGQCFVTVVHDITQAWVLVLKRQK